VSAGTNEEEANMSQVKSKPARRAKSKPTKNARAKTSQEVNGEVLTLAEAAAYLRVPEVDVLRMIQEQSLPGRKFGEEWRFLKAALQTWLSIVPEKKGLLSHFGALKDDPDAEEMLAEIYKRRGRPMTEEG
jgi:excisionase family DNA binding protein